MPRAGRTKAGASTSTRATKGGKQKQQASKYSSHAEDDEEEEIEFDQEFEGDGHSFDATQDDDPVSTIELAAVLKAFAKGKNKKAADGSKIIEKQIRDLIDSTNKNVDTYIATENQRSDKAVDALNLDDESIPVGIDAITYANLVHEFKHKNEAIINSLDTLVEQYNPENSEQYRKIVEQLKHRSSHAKKTHKKVVKSLRKQELEQLNMSEMHAETGPIIYKHLKAIVRV